VTKSACNPSTFVSHDHLDTITGKMALRTDEQDWEGLSDMTSALDRLVRSVDKMDPAGRDMMIPALERSLEEIGRIEGCCLAERKRVLDELRLITHGRQVNEAYLPE